MAHWRVMNETVSVTVTADAIESAEFSIHDWAESVGVLFDDIDKCVVELQVAEDSGGTFRGVMQVGLVQMSKELGYVDLTSYVKGISPDWVYKFVFSKAQTGGPYTLKVSMRG